MANLPHLRRVPLVHPYQAVYTLAGTERFRLDAASWSVDMAADSDTCLPVLRVRDANGETIADCTGEGFVTPGLPSPSGVEMSVPISRVDDFTASPTNGYVGYWLNDFGSPGVRDGVTIDWPQPPGLTDATGYVWLASPGAVSYGGIIGAATTTNSNTCTVTMTAPVVAGHYVMLVCSLVDTTGFARVSPATLLTVTSSVAGNVVDTGGYSQLGAAPVRVHGPDGFYVEAFAIFYRVTNPYAAGDTITLTIANNSILRFRVQAHDVTGLTFGNPFGPNAGGNINVLGAGGPTSPYSNIPVDPFDQFQWVGPVLSMSAFAIPAIAEADVMLARGGLTPLGSFTAPQLPTTGYVQAALPDLHLEPGCTVTMETVNGSGDVRTQDTLSAALLWALDE